jgi:sulfatase modifying factor 1
VSNSKFATFVEATGYVTEAEKFGNSFVADYYLSDEVKKDIKEVTFIENFGHKFSGALCLHLYSVHLQEAD